MPLSEEEKLQKYKEILADLQELEKKLDALKKEGNVLIAEAHQVIAKRKIKKVLSFISKKDNNF